MTRYEEAKAGEKEAKRIEGTTIGKAAVREFVRGLRLRMDSPFEKCIKKSWGQDRVAIAAFYFCKWLAEVPGFGGKKNESVKVLCMWKSDYFNGIRFFGNCIPKDGEDNGFLLPYHDMISDVVQILLKESKGK